MTEKGHMQIGVALTAALILGFMALTGALEAQDVGPPDAPAASTLFIPWTGTPHRAWIPLMDASWGSLLVGQPSSQGISSGQRALSEQALSRSSQFSPEAFVTRSGSQLFLDGRPYTFVGTNVNYLAGPFFPEDDVEEIISFLSDHHVQVIRVWVEPWCDLERVQRMLDIGGQYGVRFILTLQDFFNHETGHWFRSLYMTKDIPHIRNVVPLFAHRPEILAWEVMNEPTCPARDSGQDCWDALFRWAEATSAEVKRLDPNHLVSLGTQRGGLDTIALAAFQRIHGLDTVDLISIHRHANNPHGEHEQEMAIAAALDKPVFYGEIALEGRAGDGQQPASGVLEKRAADIAASIHRSRDEGVVGYLLWQYGHGLADLTNHLDYFPDDPVWPVLRQLGEAASEPRTWAP